MKRQELYNICSSYFSHTIPVAETELHFSSPYQLIVAVMLSAQCTDKRVNIVTPPLFASYPTIQALSLATPEEVYPYIRSISYPNAKAQHLVEMAKMVVERYKGTIPTTLEELVTLPGVGRKSANVMIAVAFGGQAMPVDTHVYRVSHRIGLVPSRCATPVSVERELVKYLPHDSLSVAHHQLILHGRYTCTARSPKCHQCGLTPYCKYYKSTHSTKG